MSPDRLIRYGEPITADDIADHGGADPAAWLTDLGRLLIQAELAREGLTYIVPQVTDRIRVPDGGIDAFLRITLELPGPRTPGLINPGTTVYQWKWRTKHREAISSGRGELRKLREHHPLPDVYVFITNAPLTQDDHQTVKDRLRDGCPEFPESHIVVLGAAQLKDRVNVDPRIRVTHFGATGLSTWEKAGEAAERRYGMTQAPPFQGREGEREAIQRFASDPGRRLMIVHGPHGVGKTRLVLESLTQIRDRVVWAPDAPPEPAALVHLLDDSAHPAILMVDAVPSDADGLIARALEAQHLKTIILVPHLMRAPRAVAVAVRPFDQPATLSLLRAVFPAMSYRRAQWLYDQWDGLPGLLLQGAMALESAGDRDPLDDEDFRALLESYERTLVAPLGTAVGSLAMLSVLPVVYLPPGRITRDVELLCRALDLDPARVRGDLDALRARHVVELLEHRDYEVWRVVPPLAARVRARQALLHIIVRVPDLFRGLSDYARAGLVRRVGESANEPAFAPTVEWLFTEAGIFTDLTTLGSHAGCAASLAETMPHRTAQAMLGTIQAADVEARRSGITQDAARQLVHALTGLAHREDSFVDAAHALLLLAETEEARRTHTAATAAFSVLFHWSHPELPTDARVRAGVLERLCETATAGQRRIIAAAAGAGLDPYSSVSIWQGDTVTPPEPGWWPKTWGPMQDTVRMLLRLLQRLSDDPDVGTDAQRVLARGVLATAQVGIPEEGMQALEFLASRPRTPATTAVVVGCLGGFVHALRQAVKVATERDSQARLEEVAVRGDALFARLTAEDFGARFHHWLGPAPMRAHPDRRTMTAFERMDAEAEQLAKEAMATPALLTPDLLEWAVGEEATNAGRFLWALGALDRGVRWLQPLELSLPRMRVGGGLATYVAGWADADPVGAGRYLDAIAGRGESWAHAAANATGRLAPTHENAARLLRCVTVGGLHPKHVARQLQYGRWPAELATEDLLTLVRDLRDGRQEVDWPLIEVLEACWPTRRPYWDQLGPLAVDILSNTAAKPSDGHDSSHWDALAAQLVPWDANAGFRLLLAHLRDAERGPAIFLRFERAQLLHALSEVDRPRVVRELIAAASSGRRAHVIRFELPTLLHPATDTPTLMQLIDDAGDDAARLIAGHLDASQEGFVAAFAALAKRWGTDDQVRAGLIYSAVTIREPYNDKAAILQPRFAILDQLRAHEDPGVISIAAEAGRRLREAMRGE